MDVDDRQLLIATHRGHQASARLLWARHAPRMTAHARAILRDAAGAEDAVQSVMCRLLELPGARVREVRDVPAFLALAVRREALNQIRAARRAGAREARRAVPVGEGGDALRVRAALEMLPRRMREVVVLKHVAGLTFDQMALALCTNRSTVASRYRAALAALRDLIAPREGVAHV
jgi:RNA polymerase sigma-70 factor (ECF subfamily)